MIIILSSYAEISFTLLVQCLNLSQDENGGTNCLCQRSMLVASKQVVTTIQGTLNFFSISTFHVLFSRNKQRIKEEQRVRSRKLVIILQICKLLILIGPFTRHREKLREEKNQKDIPEGHSCICVHCGRQFSGENENGYSDTSVDEDLAQTEWIQFLRTFLSSHLYT